MRSFVVALIAAGLGLAALAAGAAAKPREAPAGHPLAGPPPATDAPLLSAGRVSSLPAHARLGRRYAIAGSVVNLGSRGARGPVVLRLLKRGTRPRTIGRARAGAAPRARAPFATTVRLPSHLARGEYQLVACTRTHGTGGAPRCVVAPRTLRVGLPAARHRIRAAGARAEACSPGAHTLATPDDVRVYPEVGNGGYASVHSDVNLVYDGDANRFLSGTNVRLTNRATQCLTDFSLDFERSNADTTNGPDLTVSAVRVNGVPATFAFVQPTYPGDPHGQDDPDPLAHRTGVESIVGHGNPNPPACTPQGTDDALQNQPCPATKLVITPPAPIANNATFTVEVDYTGRPGQHIDADTNGEGWFTASGGGFVTTEPVGTMAWMPLNNYPTAKPTYTFTDRTNHGKVAIANGDLTATTTDPADPQFPGGGSVPYTWTSHEPVQNYLVENSIGNYDLTTPTTADGVVYYQAQDSSISAPQQAANKQAMDGQPDITAFESYFNGAFPFSSDGVIVGTPAASFEEEMQTKITFAGSTVVTPTLYHENMHQWWGDNVTESRFRNTFFKEGFATLSEYFSIAREAAMASGGQPGDAPYDALFDASMDAQFQQNYATITAWDVAPSDPSAADLFGDQSYNRSGTAYTALRKILGDGPFRQAMHDIQHDYGSNDPVAGAHDGRGYITEDEERAEFYRRLPQTQACAARLAQFFTQWFDTAFPSGGGDNRPQLTGQANSSAPFYSTGTTCADSTAPVTKLATAPAGGQLSVTLSATDSATSVSATNYSVDGGEPAPYSRPFTVSADVPHAIRYYSIGADGNVEATHLDVVRA